MRIAVVASQNAFQFAVIDFTNPAAITVTPVNPGFGGSCVVDGDGELVAVGNANGDNVALYNISDPVKPALLGTIKTGLVGIGCISIDGKRVLAGEANGLRATLIDFATPSAPKLVSTLNVGISSLGSVALSGARAVAAGPNNPTISIINYSSPATPSFISFDPLIGGPLVADLDGTRAVVGDQTGAFVKLIDISGPTILGTANTTLAGITGVSIERIVRGRGFHERHQRRHWSASPHRGVRPSRHSTLPSAAVRAFSSQVRNWWRVACLRPRSNSSASPRRRPR